MKKIGITGGLGSGLEKMTEIIESFGYPVFEADLAIKFMLNWREDILRNTRIQFGHDITSLGFIDAHKFKGTQKFNRLLDIIEYDLFKVYWKKFLDKHSHQELVFFKSHIIFERSWNLRFNEVIYVNKTEDRRILDIMKILKSHNSDANNHKVRHITYDIIESQIEKEYSSENKFFNCDYVIAAHDDLSLLTSFEMIRTQLVSQLTPSKIV